MRALLKESHLPTAGVSDELAHFLVAMRGDDLVGTIGLEPYGDAGLLRSAAVAAPARGLGVGEALVQRLLAHAAAQRVHTLVLLTTTAEGWFPRFGFAPIARDAVPLAVRASEEFRGACPASAVAMILELDRRRG